MPRHLGPARFWGGQESSGVSEQHYAVEGLT